MFYIINWKSVRMADIFGIVLSLKTSPQMLYDPMYNPWIGFLYIEQYIFILLTSLSPSFPENTFCTNFHSTVFPHFSPNNNAIAHS